MRISDWSSDVCSSDLLDGLEQLGDRLPAPAFAVDQPVGMRLQTEDVRRRSDQPVLPEGGDVLAAQALDVESGARDEMLQPLDSLRREDQAAGAAAHRSEEHTSELQSLMRNSYAVFCM